MTIRNAHWYSRNEGIAYPLADQATRLDDTGQVLPGNLLVDLRLVWPWELGRYAFLSGLTIGPKLVSLTISASTDLTSSHVEPLAYLAVTNPTPGRVYTLLAAQAHVAGYIVFGSGIQEEPVLRSWRFAHAQQSYFAASAARGRPAPPIEAFRIDGQIERLQDVVELQIEPPLRYRVEELIIDSQPVQAVVLELADVEPRSGRDSVLFQFAGPCAGRPESHTCGDPQPVEWLNTVQPDCDGLVTLDFEGCAIVRQLHDPCGVVLSCDFDLSQACPPPGWPDASGKLPGQFDPEVITPPSSSPEDYPPFDEDTTPEGTLPDSDCFETMASSWVIRSGSWIHATSPTHPNSFRPCTSGGALRSTDTTSYNRILRQGFDPYTVPRQLRVHACLLPAPAGGLHNASVLIHEKAHTSHPSQRTFYEWRLDFEAQQVRLRYFNGLTYQPIASAGFTVEREVWYEALVRARPLNSVQTELTVTWRNLATSDFVTLGPVTVQPYLPASGWFGLGTEQAISEFSFWEVSLWP